MKVVINCCFGGFRLSVLAQRELAAHGRFCDKRGHQLCGEDIPRDDLALVAVVEKLGCQLASGKSSDLHVVEIPDGVNWIISDYDGSECVEEVHRSWGVRPDCGR